jgi:hypothetical protein
MWGFDQLPPDLFYQIALHLPLTMDVLALTLTNSRIPRSIVDTSPRQGSSSIPRVGRERLGR